MTDDRAVSLNAVNEIWHTRYSDIRIENEEEQYKRIQMLPSIDRTVQEFADRCRECGKQRTGHWIISIEEFYVPERLTPIQKRIYECSICHKKIKCTSIIEHFN